MRLVWSMLIRQTVAEVHRPELIVGHPAGAVRVNAPGVTVQRDAIIGIGGSHSPFHPKFMDFRGAVPTPDTVDSRCTMSVARGVKSPPHWSGESLVTSSPIGSYTE
jgi:hypothetical protein